MLTGAAGSTFVIALLIFPGTASASSSGQTLGPPFIGGVAYLSNSTSTSTCGGHATVPIAPSFNNTSGHLAMRLAANATSPAPTCPGRRQGELGYAQGDVAFYSHTFTVAKSGLKIVRANWVLSFHLKLNVSGSFNSSSYCWACGFASIQIDWNLDDLTTGGSYSFPGSYLNQTSFYNTNVSLNQSYLTRLSLPISVPMTKGDSYRFDFEFVAIVQVQVNYANPTVPLDRDSAVLSIGDSTSTRLASVVIR